ncbi:LytTR family DNA-binding domain-containing protein [Bernardetia sp. ABR2-2B]|uniref:LytR/AlgR family response regulator transcription factor n=1 Tax=Bernardetia sp. ABR2-2B TaxID=3127472 RepID=UPI0030CF1E43
MKKIKCLVVDDEPLAREGLANYVKKIPFLELIGTCESALELIEKLNSVSVDAVFLDIKMPELSGIDFLRSVSYQNRPLIVLTTAYSEYALEGYELDVIDYLVKPISFSRFLKAANKLQERINDNNANKIENQEQPTFFFIKTENRLEKIYFDEILFVESKRNYIEIQTEKKGVFTTYLTLKQTEEELPKSDFLRVQKSFIVSKNAVESIEGNQIIINDKKIAISRNNSEEIINELTQNRFLKKKN